MLYIETEDKVRIDVPILSSPGAGRKGAEIAGDRKLSDKKGRREKATESKEAETYHVKWR